LIFFITGDLPAVGEQEKECDGDHCPDDEHCCKGRGKLHRFVPLRDARQSMSTVPVYRAGPLGGLGGQEERSGGIIRLRRDGEPVFLEGL
jgi:hypothetical protein